MEENENEKRKILPKRKNFVFVRFFWRKKLRRRIFQHKNFFYNVWQKMANRNLFCF